MKDNRTTLFNNYLNKEIYGKYEDLSLRARANIGGKLGIFQVPRHLYREKVIYDDSHLALLSPRAYMRGEIGIFSSPRAYMGGKLEIFPSPRVFIWGERYIRRLVPRFAWCFAFLNLGARAIIGVKLRIFPSPRTFI